MESKRTVLRMEAKDSTEEAVVLMQVLALHARNKYDSTDITTTITVTKLDKDAGDRAKSFIRKHKKEILEFLK